MNKLSKILIIFVAIIALGVVGVVLFVNEPSQPEEQSEDIPEQEYEIDLSSEVDTSDWPTLTNANGWSIKYHPGGRWRSNDMSLGPEESPGPTFELSGDYSGFWDIGEFYSFKDVDDVGTVLESWFDDLSSNFVLAKKRTTISGNLALVRLEERVMGNKTYYIFIYSETNQGVFVIRMSSGFNSKEESVGGESSQILKAMLQTLNFHEK